MVRQGSIIKLKPEMYEEYKRLHANVWQDVLDALADANVHNYSIYYRNGYLFSYFEYTGADMAADWARMGANPKVREWWLVTDPCQEPVEGNSTGSEEGNWWLGMEELFHME